MKCVVFGGGYFGKNYVRELAHNCVAVVEPDPIAAKIVNDAYNVPTHPSLPDNLKFDGAIIVTPPDSHIKLAKDLLTKGHYVLVEKPFATSVEEAYQIKRWSDRCMAAMIYLYHPEVLRLKESVKTLPLNHIYTRRTNDGPVRPWQNALWDLAAHDVSICNYILGQTPHALEAMGSRSRDWAILRMVYVAAESLTYVSWRGGPKTRLVELVPEEGHDRLVFNDMKVALEVSPMRLMLDAFLSGEWDERGAFESGVEVTNVLEKASKMIP